MAPAHNVDFASQKSNCSAEFKTSFIIVDEAHKKSNDSSNCAYEVQFVDLSNSFENVSINSLSLSSNDNAKVQSIVPSQKEVCLSKSTNSRSIRWYDSLVQRFKALGKPKDKWVIPHEDITVLKRIGCGSQGTVYQGRWHNEAIAVKEVQTKEETEVEFLRKFSHPNVISFRGVCSEAVPYYLLMEFCSAGSVYDFIGSGAEIPPQMVIEWSKQVAAGMHYLHGRNIIHRDLKSSNILIGDNQILKITDFGCAKQRDIEMSTKMTHCGTAAWIAPEVIRGEPYSEKVDIWSFGVFMWELLTCEIPYRGFETYSIIFGVGSNKLSLPIPSTCPDGLKQLLEQCWNKISRNRPSFKELLGNLYSICANFLNTPKELYFETQESWKLEVSHSLRKIKTYTNWCITLGELHDIEVRDMKTHYRENMERTKNLYDDLVVFLKQVQEREKVLRRLEQSLTRVRNGNRLSIRRVSRSVSKYQELHKKTNLDINANKLIPSQYEKKCNSSQEESDDDKENDFDHMPGAVKVIRSSLKKKPFASRNLSKVTNENTASKIMEFDSSGEYGVRDRKHFQSSTDDLSGSEGAYGSESDCQPSWWSKKSLYRCHSQHSVLTSSGDILTDEENTSERSSVRYPSSELLSSTSNPDLTQSFEHLPPKPMNKTDVISDISEEDENQCLD